MGKIKKKKKCQRYNNYRVIKKKVDLRIYYDWHFITQLCANLMFEKRS